MPNHAALTGILFVLKSGIPWAMVPQEMGCGSGVTCWRRRRAWQKARVWERLHHAVLERLGAADQSDWRRASADSASLSVTEAKGLLEPGAPGPARGREGAPARGAEGDEGQLPVQGWL